jgi:hypothetical protein
VTSKLWVALVLGVWAASVSAVDTSDANRFDLGVKTAFVLGSIDQTTQNPNDTTSELTTAINYGGMGIGLSANYDLSRWLTLSVGAHFILDLRLFQITRKGLDLTIGFHLLGGSRRTILETDDMSIMERDPTALTLLVRPGFQAYNPANSNTAIPQVDASLLGVDLGLEYRMEVGEQSSISLAFLYSLLTLPAGATKVKAKLMTFEATWRLFL